MVGNPKLSKIAEVLPCTVVEMIKERFEVTQMVRNTYQPTWLLEALWMEEDVLSSGKLEPGVGLG